MSESNPPEMVALSPPEKTRTYVYPNGQRLTYQDVVSICVRPSGTHRLELASGKKVIVAPGWAAIELDVPNWTV